MTGRRRRRPVRAEQQLAEEPKPSGSRAVQARITHAEPIRSIHTLSLLLSPPLLLKGGRRAPNVAPKSVSVYDPFLGLVPRLVFFLRIIFRGPKKYFRRGRRPPKFWPSQKKKFRPRRRSRTDFSFRAKFGGPSGFFYFVFFFENKIPTGIFF